MRFKKVGCQNCGANFEVEETRTGYSCPNCNAVGVGEQIQVPIPTDGRYIAPTDSGLSGRPSQAEITAVDNEFARLNEAEQYKLQAEFILHSVQANIQVYGSNSPWSGAQPADVDLALRYINRSLEHYPDNPAYLNLKALLLIEGKGMREEGLPLLERAHQLNPRDITIEDNLNKLKSSSACFVATVAYGTPDAWQVCALRRWRDEALLPTRIGAVAVALYYRVGAPAARVIGRHSILKSLVRVVLFPSTRWLARRHKSRGSNPK